MAAYTSIDDPSAYFKVQLYTGTGSGGSDRQITFDDTDTDMQPDLVWIKNRDSAQEHVLVDSVRGATKDLDPSENTAESTTSTRVGSFLSDGFQLGSGSLQNRVNGSSHKMVAWCWKETADAGFDIVSFTGNATARTISHSLSAVPKLMIVKNRADSAGWIVYHGANTSAPATDGLTLDTSDATDDDAGYWNDTVTTDTKITLANGDPIGGSGYDHIMFAFCNVPGFSHMGSYYGTNRASGQFVYTGFKPAYIMIKAATNVEGWNIFDNLSNPVNVANKNLMANTNAALATNGTGAADKKIDILSKGFRIDSTSTELSPDGGNVIYAAFAEHPLVSNNGKAATAR